MNLYLIWQRENEGYDTYDSAIVAAKNEKEARAIPVGHEGEWCSNPKLVKAKLIGQAARGIKAGVVLASYNAG